MQGGRYSGWSGQRAGSWTSTSVLHYLLSIIRDQAIAERDRWALWPPVFYGIGIAIYFALPVEPPLATVLGMAVVGVVGILLALRMRAGVVAGLLMLPVGLAVGLALAAWTADRVAAPVLDRAQVFRGMIGTVVAVEAFPDGARLRLEELDLGRYWRGKSLPQAVRVKLRAGTVPEVGSRITLTAQLAPPPRPSFPGAYDFARAAWFERLGAVGFAMSDWRTVARTEPRGPVAAFWIGLESLRMAISKRLRAALPGTPGGIATALLTGDRSAVPETVMEDLRISGLAHLLAISGLHIGMIAMIIFGTVRLLLALRESWARDRPIKKWAACTALIGAFCYLLLSGATVPTQRAFLMTGLVLLAVLIDRQAISMRLVAVAAVIVLSLGPEGLVGPSFQLSFAAVIALVAVYESYRMGGSGSFGRGWPRRVGFYLAAICLTTVIAGAATAPFAIHHFGRIAHYSVLANLFAVPVVTFVVMPMGVLGLLVLPLGLEAVPLTVAGWGIGAVLWVAATVAELPGSIGLSPAMPGWGLACTVLGGLWCAIWRRAWRYLGMPVVILGMASPLTQPVPVLLLQETEDQAGIVWNRALWLESTRRDKFTTRVWAEKTALPVGGDWADLMAQRDSPLRCDPLGCVLKLRLSTGGEGAIAFTADPRAVAEDCLFADATRLPIQPHPALCRERPTFGPADLRRDGVHVIYVHSGKLGVETVEAYRGDRPWTGSYWIRKPLNPQAQYFRSRPTSRPWTLTWSGR